jgi:MerR HTH family regulatory protein
MVPKGAYPADRAAALAGVPLSTVRYWAKNGILEPSVSARRVMLWSYPDLMGLRMIYWLRQEKELGDGRSVPRSSMPAVRKALTQLGELGLDLWSRDTGCSVAVDRAGQIRLETNGSHEEVGRQRLLGPDVMDLLRPFETPEHTRGPTCANPDRD